MLFSCAFLRFLIALHLKPALACPHQRHLIQDDAKLSEAKKEKLSFHTHILYAPHSGIVIKENANSLSVFQSDFVSLIANNMPLFSIRQCIVRTSSLEKKNNILKNLHLVQVFLYYILFK